MSRAHAAILLAVLAPPALAAGRAAAAERVLAVRAAKVLVAPGKVVEDAVIVVRGKLVDQVLGPGEKPPEGAETVDLGAAYVVPGFVSPITAVSERSYRGSSPPGLPSSGAGGPRDARSFAARSALKAEDTVWRRLGRSGYAAFAWLPDPSGFLAGDACVVRPAAAKEKDPGALVIKDSAYLLSSFEMGKRWRDVFEGEMKKAGDAIVKEREEKKKADEKAAQPPPQAAPAPAPAPAPQTPPQPAPPPQPAAAPPPQPAPAQPPKPPPPPDPLVRALKGEVQLLLRVRSPAAVDHFLRIADLLPVKPRFVLVVPPLPPETIAKLALRRDLIEAVVLEPAVAEPSWGSGRETSVLACSARLYAEEGLPVALAPLSDGFEGHASMPFRLAELVKAGMLPRDALAAVTTVPARLLGLEGKLGEIAKGAFASFAAYDGDPLSGTARLTRVFIDGTEAFRDDPATSKLSGEAIR